MIPTRSENPAESTPTSRCAVEIPRHHRPRPAKRMGIAGEELLNIRRGALLHDIGKMGVPDKILNKPGPLTTEEWAVMRMHPQFAYDLLLPIAYLQPAIDIPYCHHEKWDGTGYPRKLKGEEIPLAARIFALGDVYDAITSDRPYRKKWSRKRAIKYLCDQAGKYFDPQIVEIFVREIESADLDTMKVWKNNEG